MNKCYNCQTPLEFSPPYFCGEKCRNQYWYESDKIDPIKPTRSIAEIQRLLKEKANKLRSDNLNNMYKNETNPADFMEGIS
jgi:hypothetical protein